MSSGHDVYRDAMKSPGENPQVTIMNTEKAPTFQRLNAAAMRKNAAKAAQLLKTLANESRLLIMCVLAEGELSVGDLNKRIELSPSALSQHLAVLREQGLVQTRREAQTIYYALSQSHAIPLIELLHDIYCVE